MRSFTQIVIALFALLVCAFAQEDHTVYRVNTVTASSSSPAGYTAANSTSTISATHPTIVPSYAAGNTTASMAMPTASGPMASASASMPPQFEGAASSLQINGLVVALAAGVGYLVL
ncbi:hypothetical protein J4E89_010322 [Alternaria sp. Ai002NY15]|nr:hypothetical protein J4E89_010322 [Alternaria sp. Ai002NY15]